MRLLSLLLLISTTVVQAKYSHYARYASSQNNFRELNGLTSKLITPPPGYHLHFDGWHIHHYADLETHAVHVQAVPNDLSIREGREAVFDCVIKGVSHGGDIHWTKVGSNLPTRAFVQDGVLTIRQAMPEDSGTYVCSGAGKETRVQLDVRQYGPILEQRGPGRCSRDQKTCQNGECVNLNLVCDGHPDCRDQSDEQNCPVLRSCEPNEFLCDNKKMCVQKHWVCDGDNDCYDNSDEKNCGRRQPGDQCEPWEFKCTNERDRQCVPSSYQCDGHSDCMDGSDEVGCVKPTVAQPPPPNKRVNLGETIILECRAVGVPVPNINWRLNWGDICAQDQRRDRCTQTSENGFGVLTITDARGSDAGAYTCEAINVKGRVLAVPDCIVHVDSQQTVCNPAGTLPPGVPDSRGQCPCKRYTTGQRCDQCSAGAYYLNDRNPHGCLQCFCSGITKQCTSSAYFRSKERLTFNSGDQGVLLTDFSERNPLRGATFDLNSPRGFITHSDRHTDTLYWKLPAQMLGEKVTAYGGKLELIFKFSGGSAIPSGEPMVVIKGNDITLVHRARDDRNQGFAPDIEHRIVIDMYETSWEREDGRPGDREHLLMTLSDLTSILIRATHSAGQYSTSLGEVTLDIAVDRDTQQERAYAVEQCSCPPGYKGLSCEECAPGYERSGGGMYLGTCVPAQRRSQCNPTGTDPRYPDPDPRTNQCRCKPYVTGPLCDQCAANSFYFSDKNPHGCIQCFCSGVTKECSSSNWNRMAETLSFSRGGGRADGFILRSNEPENPYRSRSAPRVERDRLTFQDFGAAGGRPLYWQLPDQFTGQKATCYGGKMMVKLAYTGSGGGNSLPDIVLRGNSITIYHSDNGRSRPDRDGIVTLNLQFYENEFTREDGDSVTREHLIMTLSDLSEILVKCSYDSSMQSCSLVDISMESASEANTGLERALAVEQCRCPVGYMGTSCEDCSRGYSRTGGGLWLGLCDRCECNGHSSDCDPEFGVCQNCQHNTEGEKCERCKAGYVGDATRGTPQDCLADAQPLRCFCNNHSPRGCDSYGRCLLCEHNTEGQQCENCKPGFYGMATQGTPFDCKACPCPGARECTLEYDRDGRPQPKCKTCPPGFKGRICEDCADGYTRDETDSRKCKPIGRLVLEVVPHYLDLEEGASGQIECRIQSGKQPGMAYTLAWTRPGYTSLPTGASDRGDGKLVLRSASVADDGNYRCTASSNVAQMESEQDARVVVRPRGEAPVVMADPSSLSVPEGGPARFTCTAKGEPAPVVNWKIPRELGSTATQSNGVLEIPRCERRHNGQFECTASNRHGEGSAYVTLNVQSRGAPPVVMADPSSMTVSEGEPARFTCTARGNPAPAVNWKIPRELANTVTQSNGVLEIPRCQRNHNGQFECTASNEHGEGSAYVTLNVQSRGAPPVVMADPSSMTVSEGEPARFTCTARGDPAPTVNWKIPRELANTATQANGVLEIPRCQRNHNGQFECTATNVHGEGSAYVTLNVEPKQDPPRVEIRPVKNWDGQVGDNFDFICESTGNPPPRIEWSKEGGEFSDTVKVESNILRLQGAQRGDSGRYVCTGTNPAGMATDSASVNIGPSLEVWIEVAQPAQMLTRSDVRIPEGSPLRMTCHARGDPEPKVEWIRDIGPERGDVPEGFKPIVIEKEIVTHPDVTDFNEGEYRCRASNGEIERTAVINLEVLSPGQRSVTIMGGSEQFYRTGEGVTLQCLSPTTMGEEITWHRLESAQLPRDARIDGGLLEIPNLQRADAGEYECRSTAKDTGKTISRATVILSIQGDPSQNLVEITGSTVRIIKEGETIDLQCSAPGQSGEVEYSWVMQDTDGEAQNIENSDESEVTIDAMNHEDQGLYTCTVTDSDGRVVGKNTIALVYSYANRNDAVPVSAERGRTLLMDCPVYHIPGSPIQWAREDGQELPAGSIQKGNQLEIPNYGAEDTVYFVCDSNVNGQPTRGYVSVAPAAAGSSTHDIVVRLDVSPVNPEMGQTVTFTCRVLGDISAEPEITWNRLTGGDELPKDSQTIGRELIIPESKKEDEGTYRCNAKVDGRPEPMVADEKLTFGNPAPAETDTTLAQQESTSEPVTESPSTTSPPETTTEAPAPAIQIDPNETENTPPAQPMSSSSVIEPVGLKAVLVCPAQTSQNMIPQFEWTKVNGGLPFEHEVKDNMLTIPKLEYSDSGTYTCTVTTENNAKVRVNVTLNVTDLVPYFNGESFLETGPLPTKAAESYEIELNFKPEKEDGLLLYSVADESDIKADFIAVGMNEGRFVYRFDMGNGVTALESNEKLPLNEWHSAKIIRDGQEATLLINGEKQGKATSIGDENTMNLGKSVFIGGLADFSKIDPDRVGFQNGYKGTVSSYKSTPDDDASKNFEEEILSHRDLMAASVCNDNSCKNNGQCIPANIDQGFKCQCETGTTGKYCEWRQSNCPEGSCSGGICVNKPGGEFGCICGYKMRLEGNTCVKRREALKTSAYLTGEYSFISLKNVAPNNGKLKTKIRIRPEIVDEDSVVMFSTGANSGEDNNDYVRLVIKDGYLELQFDSGDGPAVIRSEKKVKPNEWQDVEVNIDMNQGSLILDGSAFSGQSGGAEGSRLNLKPTIHLGGAFDDQSDLESLGIVKPFTGCLKNPIAINENEVNLWSLGSEKLVVANVDPCHESDPCLSNPCAEGATCLDQGDNEFECLCPANEEDCTQKEDKCSSVDCGPQGVCRTVNQTETTCDCKIPYMGEKCDQFFPADKQLGFNGDGYLELDGELLSDETEKDSVIEFKIRTEEKEGIILWYGMPPDVPSADTDFLTLGLFDGFLEFHYNLGFQQGAQIVSSIPLNDGNSHTIKAVRNQRHGQLFVDNLPVVHGEAPGILTMLNNHGNIYIGGVPNLEMTNGKHEKNFIGCIADLAFDGQKIDFLQDKLSGVNANTCESQLRRKRHKVYRNYRRRMHIVL